MVLKRSVLDLFFDGDSAGFVSAVLIPHPHARTVESSEDLVTIQFSDPEQLETFVKDLLTCGFKMTRDGKFDDFAIVHGVHGLAMPCDWLDLKRVPGGGTVSLKTVSPDPLDFSQDIFPWESSGWITELGHGFMLSREDDYDVWLDFNTGRTIVSLKPPTSVSMPP